MKKLKQPESVFNYNIELNDESPYLEPDDMGTTAKAIYFKYKDHLFIYGIFSLNIKKDLDNIAEHVQFLDVRLDEPPRHHLRVDDNQFKFIEIVNDYNDYKCILSEIFRIDNIDVDYCVNYCLEETFIIIHDLYLKNCIIDAADHNFYQII